ISITMARARPADAWVSSGVRRVPRGGRSSSPYVARCTWRKISFPFTPSVTPDSARQDVFAGGMKGRHSIRRVHHLVVLIWPPVCCVFPCSSQRQYLGRLSARHIYKCLISLVGAPGLEPGTR